MYWRTPSLHRNSSTLAEERQRSCNVNPFATFCDTGVTQCVFALLSHGPWRAAAEWGQVWLLLLDLQHQHQAGVLVTEEVQQEHQEVVDDVGLVALPASVHVDGQAGIAQSQPLDKSG